MPAADFFAFARKRHQIYLDRFSGKPKPWTDDPILQMYSFTNVFRELDKTTIWFRKNVREKYDGKPEVLLATMVFRWFNRITTGEAIFSQEGLLHPGMGNFTAFEAFQETGETQWLKDAILAYIGDSGPYVTGSYIIKTDEGMSKLDGVLHIIDLFNKGRWRQVAEAMPNNWTLQQSAEWLESEHHMLGHFTAYEVTSDLRWTYLLTDATDVGTWANPGPGARRGLNRVAARDLRMCPAKTQEISEMRDLLALSRDPQYWPQNDDVDPVRGGPAWPPLEMREIEHTLCEFDKFCRTLAGEGRPRGRFRGGI